MNYLYFILPPVVIVISVALILLLLSKKSLNIEESRKNRLVGNQNNFLKFKKQGFSILEKSAHLFKVFFLRLHNKLEGFLKNIKKRKEIVLHETKKFDFKDSFDEVSKEDQAAVCEESVDIHENSEPKRFERKTRRFGFEKKDERVSRRSWKTLNFSKKDEDKKESLEKKSVTSEDDSKNEVINDIAKKKKKNAPMVSDEVVYPERRKKRQENKELESILVERIAKDPRDVDAYERLGDYYEETENFEDALPCFKYVLKLSPDNKRAQVKIAEIEKEIEK